jgi:LysR family glycine cleavage system transcriptional activator
MSPPSLDNLRCFLAAARASNFRRAARTMALTPTAFGQRIKQLEEQVGTRLFARTTRSVALTQHGLALVPVAERCLAAAEDCARIALGPADQPPMELTVGTRHELGMSWVLPQRAALMRARPWLSLHLYFSSGPDLLLRVRTLDIDCAITSSPFADPKLDSFQLHREDYVFVGAASLLSRMPLSRPADAARHTIFDTTSDMPLFRYWRDAPGGGDRLRFLRGSWLGGIDAIREQVRAGNGLAVLPQYFVRADLTSRRLRVVLPKVVPVHDYFRLVFRAADPRRAVFEGLATDLAAQPLR